MRLPGELRAPSCGLAHVTGNQLLPPMTGWEKYAWGGRWPSCCGWRRGRGAAPIASWLRKPLDVAETARVSIGELPELPAPAPPAPSRGVGKRWWEGKDPVLERGHGCVRGREVESCKRPLFAGRAAPGFPAPDLCLMNYNMN